ncbi:MAG: hypothetical protein K0R63_45 [Rickettsiales bacterium]|jgi:hypothetical protein|nr:hypothetical protein [Rickettsiales bacterium]
MIIAITDTTELIEFMGGILFFLWGISFLIRAGSWTLWFKRLERDGKPSALTLGSSFVIIGGLGLALHPIWSGIPSILTTLEILAIAIGAIYLLFPEALSIMLRCISAYIESLIRAVGLALIVLSLLLLQDTYDNHTITKLLDFYPNMEGI